MWVGSGDSGWVVAGDEVRKKRAGGARRDSQMGASSCTVWAG